MLREVHSEAGDMVPGSDVITQLLLTEDPQHAQGTLLRAALEIRAVDGFVTQFQRHLKRHQSPRRL